MTREFRLRERLSLALRHAMPEYAQQEAWAAHVSKHTQVPAGRVLRQMRCEHRVAGDDLLAYFEHFGPDFERQVRGPKS